MADINKTGQYTSSQDTLNKMASGEIKLCPQCKSEMTKSASVCSACGTPNPGSVKTSKS